MKRRILEQREYAELTVNSDSQFAVEALIQEIDGFQILEVDIWGKKDVFGRRGMMCRHFLDKNAKEFDTLFMTDQAFQRKTYHAGEWSRMKMSSILARGDYCYSYWPDRDTAVSEEAKRIVERYIPMQDRYSSGIRCVEEKENSIQQEKSETAYHRKIDRISDIMNAVEPIVDDTFREWLNTVVFPERYIFAETRKLKRGYRCRCAECGKTFLSAEKPKHNTQMECKKCGTEAMVKTRVQQVTEEKAVLVAQQYDKDSWVLRHFKFQRYSRHMMKETKSSIQELEKARMIMKLGNTTKTYWGQDRSYGADEWQQDWWDSKAGNGMTIDHKFFMYPGRLPKVDMPVILKRMLTAGAQAGVEMDYNQLIRSFNIHPYIEYLIKGRYYKLANYIIKVYGYWSRPEGLLDIQADNVFDLLQIEPQRAYRLRDMNGGRCALELLQIEERDGIKISQENLEFADKYEIDTDDLEVNRTGMSINKVMNYVQRQMKRNNMSFKMIKQYYHDYLDMAAQRGADLTDDIIRANSRMIEFHMAYLEEQNRKEDAERLEKLKKQFPNIKKDHRKNEELMGWENEEYIVMVPKEVTDIVLEGKAQHHCVAATDTYFDRMNKRQSFILFLRRKNKPQIPYYTLEITIKDGKVGIKQSYAAYDRQPDKKTVDKVLAKWKKVVETRAKEDKQIKAKAS